MSIQIGNRYSVPLYATETDLPVGANLGTLAYVADIEALFQVINSGWNRIVPPNVLSVSDIGVAGGVMGLDINSLSPLSWILNTISGNNEDVVISTDTTITDLMSCHSLTINAGVTVNIQTSNSLYTAAIIAESITNNGTINRTQQRSGAGIVNRRSTDIIGAGGKGANSGYGGGGGGGGVGGVYGSGATASGATGNSVTYTDKLTDDFKTILEKGMYNAIFQGIQGQTLTDLFVNQYGASGGVGGNGTPGGLGGGALMIVAKDFNNYGIIQANGGQGGTQGLTSGGGGGGSAGYILMSVTDFDNNNGTIRVNGGWGGTGYASQGGGGGGGGGIIYVLYTTLTAEGTVQAIEGNGGGGGATGDDGVAGTVTLIQG